MDDGGDAVALRGGGDGRDDPVGGHANGGLAVENGQCCGRCAWCFSRGRLLELFLLLIWLQRPN